jgi:arylsulfatase A-like enzyme
VSSPMPKLLIHALLLGALSGALEVGLRASARLGLSGQEQLVWLGFGVLFGLCVSLPVSLAAFVAQKRWGFERGVGLTAAALLALHGALFIRFEWVLNASVSSPKVWAPLLAVLALSLLLGHLLDGFLRRTMRAQIALFLFAACIGFWRGNPAKTLSTSEQPNVLLVTFDTTRADRLSAYGGQAKTPTIDALAQRGVLYEQAIAPAPLTEASHLAILTGTAVYRTGLYSNGTALGERPDLLSHAFKEAGYRTGAVVSGFPLHGKYGWTQGFDFYDDDFGATPGLHRLSLMKAWDQLRLPGNTLRERPGIQTLARAQSFLNRHKSGPFFMWVHFFDPHAPYEVTEEALANAPRVGEALELPAYWPPAHKSITSTDWFIEAYEGEIEATDALFGQLLEGLGADVLAKTVVAFTADHGESLTEHGSLFDHGNDLYDASLHIPLVLAGPGVPSGRVVPCQVSGIDLAPSLRRLAGLEELSESKGAGRDLAPFSQECTNRPVHSGTVAARHVPKPPIDHSLRLPLLFEEAADERMSKFIKHGAGGERLFDLVSDPAEELNVVEAFPQTASRVGDLMKQILEGAAVTATPESDPATLDALKALGYLE